MAPGVRHFGARIFAHKTAVNLAQSGDWRKGFIQLWPA
jgi:hypothetical protein